VDRAYSLLEIKSVAAPQRTFSGIASTPELDRQGDSFDPAGATFRESLPLLFHHDPKQPIGRVTLTRTPAGIVFDATIPEVDEPGPLKTRVDEAWQSIKAGVITGVSIGHRVLEGGLERLKNGTRRITRSEICELSLVTIPANASASILTVKSLSKGSIMTIAERIQGLTQTRADLGLQMKNLMESAPAGSTLDETTAATVDGLKLQIKNCEADETRWRDMEAVQMTKATAIVSPYAHVSVKSNLPPGTAFVRYVCAQLACKQFSTSAYDYAQRWNDSTPEVALALKAAVAPGTATDATWASPLVQPNISKEFVELLRAATIVDKIPGLYSVPFNTKIPQQTGGGTYNWVGETKPKPVSALAFASLTLDWSKIAGIIVLTQELIKLSSPKAEDVVRRDMIAGIARFIDAQFTDPAVAAVAGVNPASITNGAPTAAATANPLADILGLISHFTTNNIPVDGLTFIMSPANAMALSFKTYSDGSPQFPGIGVAGGTWKGLTFIVSNTVTTKVIALQPSLVFYADDGGVTIDASSEASLQMDSAPMSPVDATTVYVSMFQANCVALRAERFINWKKANANAVKYLTAAAWPAPTGVTFGDDEPEAPTANGKTKRGG
jgi:HK97 family phage major capsid protein/HK97 family phage prohead protease